MSVPVSRRHTNNLLLAHTNYYSLRKEVTELLLNRFGFSKEKYEKKIEFKRKSFSQSVNSEEILRRWVNKYNAFNDWFISKETDAILSILRKMGAEFTFGNSIYPSDTPSKLSEFCERRKHINNAISYCFVLKQELQYVIETLPVDINKYERFAKLIDRQIDLYKGVRRADNRFVKKYKDSEIETGQYINKKHKK